MSDTFADKLIRQIRQKQSIVCIGLDPRIGESSTIPQWLIQQENDPNDIIWRFNKQIIDQTHNIAPIYKPQIAFYEKYGALDALAKTINYIQEKGALALLDAKRNDIGSTSEAYADFVFQGLNADAVTVNSYFGIDGVAPFLQYINQGKGVILLLKTSNPSSGEFQDLFSVDLPKIPKTITEISVQDIELVRNYIQMTRLLRKWADESPLIEKFAKIGNYGYSSLGGVVGATYPEQLQQIRKEIPNSFILIPGYGAQGGTAQDIVHGVNNDGLGAIVNASRSIDYAYQREPYKDQFTEKEFAQAAAQSAMDMRDNINKALTTAGKRFK